MQERAVADMGLGPRRVVVPRGVVGCLAPRLPVPVGVGQFPRVAAAFAQERAVKRVEAALPAAGRTAQSVLFDAGPLHQSDDASVARISRST
jgi:hypothetical protein